jgi:hypothetical protein
MTTYRTTDPGQWGTGKGSPLSANEGDQNIWDIVQRLEELETNPPVAVGIASITATATALTVHLTDGSEQGPFTLPTAMFNDTGEYIKGFLYYPNDLIHASGFGVYRVNIEHTSHATNAFDPTLTDGSGHNLYKLLAAERTAAYEFGFYFPGLPGNEIEIGGNMAAHIAVEDFYLPIGLAGSFARLFVAPTADVSYPLKKNTTTIGSIEFAAGAVVGTFTFAANVQFTAGDVARLARATGLDATAKELSVTFVGTYGTIPTP